MGDTQDQSSNCVPAFLRSPFQQPPDTGHTPGKGKSGSGNACVAVEEVRKLSSLAASQADRVRTEVCKKKHAMQLSLALRSNTLRHLPARKGKNPHLHLSEIIQWVE